MEGKAMIKDMDLNLLVKLRLKGYSYCKIADMLGVHRKTVAKYWNSYTKTRNLLQEETDEIKRLELQEALSHVKPYNSSTRRKTKITNELIACLQKILDKENEKEKILKSCKQNLTKKQIHKMIKKSGYDISYSTLTEQIRKMQGPDKKCYIRQKHDYGERLEYDFGNIKLQINDVVSKFCLAVITAPASYFRWCYLYETSKQDVFLDSHVRFFEMVGGVWNEIVYDNMRNVVTRFIGKNEKEVNPRLIELANYYGFSINVTNAYSGNEKGHVESSVKFLRNQIFAEKYSFKSISEAKYYLNNRLRELNSKSNIKEEQKHLIKALPPFELSTIRPAVVDKCSLIKVDNNFYSVPEYLVGRKVTVKNYIDKIIVYSNNNFVCKHKKLNNKNQYSINIMHYLKTLKKKPNAIKDSIALRCLPELRKIFLQYYNKSPKTFIDLLENNKNKSYEELIRLAKVNGEKKLLAATLLTSLSMTTRKQTLDHNSLIRRN